MDWKRIAVAAALTGAGLGVGGCADQYGYGGVSAGYGYAGGYGDGYGYADGYGYDQPYGYGYGDSSYFGWFGDYYYPGTGIYVYDRYRRPFRWNNSQQRYWQSRRNGYRGNGGFQNNWNGFARRDGGAYGNRYPGGANGQGYRNGYGGRGGVEGQGYRGVYPGRDGVEGQGYRGGYQGRGTADGQGYRGGYQGRSAADGQQFRPDVNRNDGAGREGFGRRGDAARAYGGAWRDRSAGATAAPTPQNVTPPAQTGTGGRTWGGGGSWRGGRGRH